MNTNQSSILSSDLFPKEFGVFGLLSSEQLLQEGNFLEGISLSPHQPSVPLDKITRLAHHLHDRVPLLNCVDFELDHLSKIQTFGSMTLSHSMMNSRESIKNSPCLQIFTVATFLAAIRLAISFPKAFMFCRGLVCDATSLIFVKPQGQTGSGLWQNNRLQGRCSVDQDALLDQALIFQDRGHCDIQMYVQFFHCENPMAYASPTIALYRDPWSSSGFPDTFKNGHRRPEGPLWKSEGKFKQEAVNLAIENEINSTKRIQKAGSQLRGY